MERQTRQRIKRKAKNYFVVAIVLLVLAISLAIIAVCIDANTDADSAIWWVVILTGLGLAITGYVFMVIHEMFIRQLKAEKKRIKNERQLFQAWRFFTAIVNNDIDTAVLIYENIKNKHLKGYLSGTLLGYDISTNKSVQDDNPILNIVNIGFRHARHLMNL